MAPRRHQPRPRLGAGNRRTGGRRDRGHPDVRSSGASRHCGQNRRRRSITGRARGAARIIAVSVRCRRETAPGTDLDADHWRRCLHGRHRIGAAAGALAERPVDLLLEIGMAPLADDERPVIAKDGPATAFVPGLAVSNAGAVDVMTAVATLYAAGAVLQWDRLVSAPARCVCVPSYPWQRQRLWALRGNWLPEKPAELPGQGQTSDQRSATPPAATINRRNRPDLTAPYVAPRTVLETGLVQAWSEVLNIDGIGIHDNFFELGGHSLLATQLLLRINRELNLHMPLRDLFEAVTIEKLGDRIVAVQRAGTEQGPPPIEPAPREGVLPMAYNQEPFWVSSYLQSRAGTVRVSFGHADQRSARRRGDGSRQLNEIVRRHEPLRTTFAEQGDVARAAESRLTGPGNSRSSI